VKAIFNYRLAARRAASQLLTAFALMLCVAGVAPADTTARPDDAPLAAINYRLSMPRPASHLFEVKIEVEIAKDAAIDHLDFQMPRWSPGRYSIFDFAVNVQQFSATAFCPDDDDCVLPREHVTFTRMDDQTWRVKIFAHKWVRISYRVFGNDLSGTFSQLNEHHANFNGGSIFMYIVGHKPDPVRLRIDPPEGWRIANGWMQSADQREWLFPNYDLLIDTPTEIAPDWTVEQFTWEGKTYRVVVHSLGAEGGRRRALVSGIERIVRAETAMWGAPEFDSYTFLIHFAADGQSGDGMEHLTSTQLIEPGSLADQGALESTLDSAAHEFFHVWNVKRLRPAELGPWDFTRPLSTRSLWIAEGITNYYGHLMQRRAGIWTDDGLLERLGQQISEVENAPGSRLMSAEESSMLAPFLDGGAHAQKTNLENTSVSYYPKGEVLGLVLDLLIRRETGGRASLDDVMRRMYQKFYVESAPSTYYLRGRGYATEDFERTATEIAGKDLQDFFNRYVRGVETPPYDEALATVGLRLVPAPARASTGSSPSAPGLTSVRSEASHLTPPLVTYRIQERRDATPQQRALRAAWMRG
jgi:predicted metalloprotease with PDZ domain